MSEPIISATVEDIGRIIGAAREWRRETLRHEQAERKWRNIGTEIARAQSYPVNPYTRQLVDAKTRTEAEAVGVAADYLLLVLSEIDGDGPDATGRTE